MWSLLIIAQCHVLSHPLSYSKYVNCFVNVTGGGWIHRLFVVNLYSLVDFLQPLTPEFKVQHIVTSQRNRLIFDEWHAVKYLMTSMHFHLSVSSVSFKANPVGPSSLLVGDWHLWPCSRVGGHRWSRVQGAAAPAHCRGLCPPRLTHPQTSYHTEPGMCTLWRTRARHYKKLKCQTLKLFRPHIIKQ